LFAGAIVAGIATPAAVAAGEFDLAGGLGATTSAWDGDTGTGTSLKLGYFFDRVPWLAPIFLARFEVVPVDDRVVHYFSFGAEARQTLGPLRGYLRAGLVHAHEESRSAFWDQFFQSIFGVGDGLRHRGGVNLGIGVEIPVRRYERGDIYVALDVGGTTFADDRGPSWYVSASGALGFRLGRGPRFAKQEQPRVADAR
jgi:hypothetical protein